MRNARPITSVAIVEDCPLTLFALQLTARRAFPDAAIHTHDDPGSLLASLEAQSPQVVVTDLIFRESTGLDLINQLRQRRPRVRILVYSCREETHYRQRCLQAGALGYLGKCSTPAEVLAGMQQVGRGERIVDASDRLAAAVVARPDDLLEALSDREMEVFLCIGQGMSNRAIAERMCRSIKTVETYQWRIKKKLGVDSKLELAQHACRHYEQVVG